MDSFEEDEPPPPYSPGPGQHTTFLETDFPNTTLIRNHTPDANQTFDCIERHIAGAKHCHEIRRYGHDRFTIERVVAVPSTSGPKIEGQTITNDGMSHTTLYAHSHRVASARFFERRGYCEIYRGSAYDPLVSQWEPIQYTPGSLLHSTSYEFKIGSRRLAWRHSHGPHLFGGSGNWVLEDLAAVGTPASSHHHISGQTPKIIIGGHTIAVFRAKPCSWIIGRSPEYVVGQVKWGDEYGEEVELIALLTLVVALQQT